MKKKLMIISLRVKYYNNDDSRKAWFKGYKEHRDKSIGPAIIYSWGQLHWVVDGLHIQ